MRVRLLWSLVALAILSGCGTLPWIGDGKRAAARTELTSYVTDQGHPELAEGRLAEDLAAALADFYPPGHTRVHLKPSDPRGQDLEGLGQALEQALRARGFVLQPVPGPGYPTVAFILDRLDAETWYTSLMVSDGLTLSRTWSWSGTALEAWAVTRTTER